MLRGDQRGVHRGRASGSAKFSLALIGYKVPAGKSFGPRPYARRGHVFFRLDAVNIYGCQV